MNVLLVDDEATLRKMVKLALQQRGFQVFDAAGGADALALSQQYQVDVLVTDVVMEGMDGWTLAHLLSKRCPDLPVVFMSGCPINFEGEREKYGRSAFLAKPFRPEGLMNAISEVAAGVRAPNPIWR